jgi:hypothetical protein
MRGAGEVETQGDTIYENPFENRDGGRGFGRDVGRGAR